MTPEELKILQDVFNSAVDILGFLCSLIFAVLIVFAFKMVAEGYKNAK